MQLVTEIFDKQRELMHKYDAIVAQNGLDLPEGPVDSYLTQALVKRTAHAAIEEFIEFYDDTSPEEYSDGLHFLVETMLLCEIGPAYVLEYAGVAVGDLDDLIQKGSELYPLESLQSRIFMSIYWLERAMHQLKNNPWKQTWRPVDRESLYGYLSHAMLVYLSIAPVLGLDGDEVHAIYMDKNRKNLQRQTAGY